MTAKLERIIFRLPRLFPSPTICQSHSSPTISRPAQLHTFSFDNASQARPRREARPPRRCPQGLHRRDLRHPDLARQRLRRPQHRRLWRCCRFPLEPLQRISPASAVKKISRFTYYDAKFYVVGARLPNETRNDEKRCCCIGQRITTRLNQALYE